MENQSESSSNSCRNVELNSEDEIFLNFHNFYLDESGDAVVNEAYDEYLSRQPSTSGTRASVSNVQNNGDQNSFESVNSDDALLNRVYNQYEENQTVFVDETDEIDHLLYDAVSGYERDVRRIAIEHDYINVGEIFENLK